MQQFYFRTNCTSLLLSKHRINSVVCSFLQLLNMRSFVYKIWCVPLPLFIATSPPAYQLSVVFLSSHPTSSLPSLFWTWKYFTVETLSPKNKYQWLNKLCYHFDMLLKKFVKGNSNLLVGSRKLVECISRLFFCKTFFTTRKLSLLICCEKTPAIFTCKKF